MCHTVHPSECKLQNKCWCYKDAPKKFATPNSHDSTTTGDVWFRKKDASVLRQVFSTNTYLLTYLLTPWSRVLLEKLTGFAANQEIPPILWNPMVHYRIHKCPPPVPILCQSDPFHTLTSYLLKNHLNIILPSTPGSLMWSLSFRFPHQNPVYASPLPPYALHAPPISFFSILSPGKYWVRRIDHSAPHYAVSSTPLLPRPS